MIAALVKSLLLAVAVLALCYWLIPEPAAGPAAPAQHASLGARRRIWMALRAALVVLPPFLLALGDPAAYMPIPAEGRQSGAAKLCTTARGAARELLGSTLLGGLLAMLSLVGAWPVRASVDVLPMDAPVCAAAPRASSLPDRAARLSPGFWLNALVTLIILLGQSVEDSAAGKDVYHAFVVRMGLFIGVTLYACLMLLVLDQRRRAASPTP
ncbi:hypothetical protein ACTMU2_40450 [Cupriavidus basilensis]